jgi:micrococcal nuclease
MKGHWIYSIPLFFLIFIFPSSTIARDFQGRVKRVFDGDTFLVLMENREEFVRLREIDAPEITTRKQVGQEPWGRKARDFAISKVQNRTVRLEVEEKEERDPFHRLLAYIFVDDRLINLEIIQSGQAFFYGGLFRGKYASQLEMAEEVARVKGVGVWDRENGLQERPKDFRARRQRDESLFSPWSRLPSSGKKSKQFQGFPVPQNKIVGNKRTMVYHPPGSPAAARVSPKNRVFFDSPEEAEKAGFRRAKRIRISEVGIRNGKETQRYEIPKSTNGRTTACVPTFLLSPAC